jgi:flagellar motor switch protein FliM
MSQILSQDEVNALLGAVAEGTVKAGDGTPGPSGAIRTLDLTRQDRSVRGLAGLELVAERFARALRATCGTWFGQVPAVSVRGLELTRADAFMAALPPGAGLQVFKLTPLRGQGLLVVPPPMLAALLHLLFGGSPARIAPLPERERSPIELQLMERVMARILADLRDAWAPVEAIAFAPVRLETNPQRAAVTAAQELLLQCDVQVEVPGGGDPVVVSVAIPNGALDAVQGKLAGGPEGDAGDTAAPDPAWTARLRQAVLAAEVDVSADLGSHDVPLARVLELKVGDVIGLATGREGPVVVRVEGQERFVGAPGVAAGHNAVRVTGGV